MYLYIISLGTINLRISDSIYQYILTYRLYSGVVGLNSIEKKVLNKIVEHEGDCLSHLLCESCPFREDCLPRFLTKGRFYSKDQRKHMAIDALARLELMLDEE